MYEIWNNFSKKSDGYDEKKSCDDKWKVWSNISRKENALTMIITLVGKTRYSIRKI